MFILYDPTYSLVSSVILLISQTHLMVLFFCNLELLCYYQQFILNQTNISTIFLTDSPSTKAFKDLLKLAAWPASFPVKLALGTQSTCAGYTERRVETTD